MNFLTGLCAAVTQVFNYLTGRSNANNAADVKVAAKGKEEAKAVDVTNTAIEKRDVKEIQDEIS